MREPVTPTAPAWARWGAFSLALVGLAVSTYLTIEHATDSSTLACPETGVINCATVLSSSRAAVLGVPVAIWGLAYFVTLAALTAPPAWHRGRRRLDRIRLALACLGVVAVIYLIAVELFVVDAICLWCTVVHAAAIGLFAVLAMDLAGRPDRARPR
jgi:uncharacterized membrane protein